MVLRKNHQLAGHAEPFKSGGNRILILDYQCSKQIVEVKHLSASAPDSKRARKSTCLARIEYESNTATILPQTQMVGCPQRITVENR